MKRRETDVANDIEYPRTGIPGFQSADIGPRTSNGRVFREAVWHRFDPLKKLQKLTGKKHGH